MSDKASISDAVMVFPGAHIVAGAVLGVGCVVNTGALVEHDCVLNDWVSIGPSATLAGGVTIEQRSFVGARSVVIQNLKVGSDSIIGAGSVVISNVDSLCVAYGNPARQHRKRVAGDAYL